jgi:DNA-binding LytR/AlgR family response regulator
VLNAGTSVDVVFSDVQLPGGMDGFGLARWIDVSLGVSSSVEEVNDPSADFADK